MPTKPTDLTGRKVGHWTVLRMSHKTNGKYYWWCRCDCGTEKAIYSSALSGNRTKSCGCSLSWETNIKRLTTHGLTKSAEFIIWSGMLARCNNKNHSSYKHYGARGIKVCERWSSSFENFLADMGKRPNDEYEIDRIDPNLDYFSGNCRWLHWSLQSANRRCIKKYTYNGQTMSLTEWSKQTGMTIFQLHTRIYQLWWPLERALTKPIAVVTKLSIEDKNRRKYIRNLTSRYVKEGKLTKALRCQVEGCTTTLVQAHHYAGYDSKECAMKVQWVCQQHHARIDEYDLPRT